MELIIVSLTRLILKKMETKEMRAKKMETKEMRAKKMETKEVETKVLIIIKEMGFKLMEIMEKKEEPKI